MQWQSDMLDLLSELESSVKEELETQDDMVQAETNTSRMCSFSAFTEKEELDGEIPFGLLEISPYVDPEIILPGDSAFSVLPHRKVPFPPLVHFPEDPPEQTVLPHRLLHWGVKGSEIPAYLASKLLEEMETAEPEDCVLLKDKQFWRGIFLPELIPASSHLTLNLDGSWQEIERENFGKTVKNSGSLNREIGSSLDYVRGSVDHVPFHPGGIQVQHESKDQLFKRLYLNSIDMDHFFRSIIDEEAENFPEVNLMKDLKFRKLFGANNVELADKSSDLPKEETGSEVANDEFSQFHKGSNIEVTAVKERFDQHNFRLDHLLQQSYLLSEDSDEEETDDRPSPATVPNPIFEMSSLESKEDRDLEFLKSLHVPNNAEPPKSLNNSKQYKWAVEEKLKSADELSTFREQVPMMAIEYPFELDSFQKQAVLHLEKNECVFVSAHTSAGKTVVAEYAIALASKHLTRAIYTSPIKTLSNQKYREFKKTFGDVGLITGDVSINPNATCLILTTEILRSMLYRGADLIRDVEWVIFDEVHYISDADRGVVWEEVIIMLPQHINVILLSATVPNTMEFADWVGRTKQKQVYVISTYKRPVPLQHYLWASKELFLIVDAQASFFHHNFERARFACLSKKNKEKELQSGKPTQMNPYAHKKESQKTQWIPLLNYLKKQELLPVVVFSLSKKKCELAVHGLQSVDLCTQSDKSEIHVMIENALRRVHSMDRALPQILRVCDMLKRGVGIHHSGLLPIVKELVEMVFSRGLVKVLFATETFAMGVNMPTRTVVFNGLRKFDGRNHRELLPGEYTQMAGRAGRRGLDTFGTVIINCANNEIPDETLTRFMILGKPTKLESRFRLTYNMILNLLRVEDLRVEDIIKRSFSEFNSQKDIPVKEKLLENQQKNLVKLSSEHIECMFNDPKLIDDYHGAFKSSQHFNALMMRYLCVHQKGRKVLTPGRVLSISKLDLQERPAVILSTKVGDAFDMQVFSVLILTPKGYNPSNKLKAALESEPIYAFDIGSQYLITTIRYNNISMIADHLLKVDTAAILLDNRIGEIIKLVSSLQQLADSSDLYFLDPLHDLQINDIDFNSNYENYVKATERYESSPCHTCPKVEEHFEIAKRRALAEEQLELLKVSLSEDNIDLITDFRKRLLLLQELQYIDHENSVQLKGRVACEINTCESLIVTELIFDNALTTLEPEEIVSLLSCFVFQQKVDDGKPQLSTTLQEALTRVTNIASNLAREQMKYRIDVTPESFISENINPGLMEVVYEWARGTPFSKITDFTLVEEGVIVRCITRLNETCRDVRNAARVIGDYGLYQKMEAASNKIKRDIVFAASLYVQ